MGSGRPFRTAGAYSFTTRVDAPSIYKPHPSQYELIIARPRHAQTRTDMDVLLRDRRLACSKVQLLRAGCMDTQPLALSISL